MQSSFACGGKSLTHFQHFLMFSPLTDSQPVCPHGDNHRSPKYCLPPKKFKKKKQPFFISIFFFVIKDIREKVKSLCFFFILGTYPPPCICPVHMSVLAEARTYTHVFGHIHIPDICTVQCIQCTVAKTHSELSGRCVGGASPLRVFQGMGLKKGENGSNTRGGGVNHPATRPLLLCAALRAL